MTGSDRGHLGELCVALTRRPTSKPAAELDLLVLKVGRRYGLEMKRQDAPRRSTSVKIALDDLRPERPTVLDPGTRAAPVIVHATMARAGSPEAGVASPFGLTPEQTLASITINAAGILGGDRRVGSIEGAR